MIWWNFDIEGPKFIAVKLCSYYAVIKVPCRYWVVLIFLCPPNVASVPFIMFTTKIFCTLIGFRFSCQSILYTVCFLYDQNIPNNSNLKFDDVAPCPDMNLKELTHKCISAREAASFTSAQSNAKWTGCQWNAVSCYCGVTLVWVSFHSTSIVTVQWV